MKYINRWLDRTTMYRVVLYVLIAYVVVALALSFTDYLYYSPFSIIASLGVLLVSGTAVHYLCAWLWKAPANIESTIITLLILFLIFDPTDDVRSLSMLAIVGLLSVVGKYVIAWRKLHLFNPVAMAAVVAALSGVAYATWWVGNMAMLIPVLVGGLLITAKIRRWELVISAVLSALVMYILVGWFKGSLSLETLESFFVAWPIIFFATVMVTEPLATPAGTRNHIIYGVIVGTLSSTPFHYGVIYSSPELALLITNMLMYPTTLRARVVLTLKSIREIAQDTYEYVFDPSVPLNYTPGQYLEWTLPHEQTDRRGIRRYFTIASSPTESEIILGLKIPRESSRFKQELQSMKPGDHLYVTSLDGDFVLPHNGGDRPLVFIAGGIGITPFRSMVKYMIDSQQGQKTTLFFCNKRQQDIVWQELWDQAQEQFGMQTVHVLDGSDPTWQGERGYIDQNMLKRYVDDLHDPVYYISGPPGMVNAYKKLLRDAGVSSRNIVTDFFPGLA